MSPDLVDLLLKGGPTGIVIVLFILGWIYAKPAMDAKNEEITYLKQALADEKAAHLVTRQTHAEEIRAGLALSGEAAKTAVHLLTDLKSRDLPRELPRGPV